MLKIKQILIKFFKAIFIREKIAVNKIVNNEKNNFYNIHVIAGDDIVCTK